MSYKVIVADDETASRNAIVRIIEACDDKLKVVAACANGVEAKEFIRANNVDIVVTDIKMPEMGGIELAEYIQSNSPDTKVLIISGYGEFEYARSAMKFGVENYILKPIDIGEFEMALNVIKTSLDKKYEEIDQVIELNMLRRGEFLEDLFMGVINDKTVIKQKFSGMEFPFSIEKSKGQIIKLKFKNYQYFLTNIWHYGKDKINLAVLNVIEKSYENTYCYPILSGNDELIFAFIENDGESVSLSGIHDTLLDFLSLEAGVVSICSFESICELPEKAWIYRNKDESIRLIITHIKKGDIDSAKRLLKKIIQNFSPNDRQEDMLHLKESLISALSFYDESLSVDTELSGDMKNIGSLLESIINKENDKENDIIIKKIKSFIEENYNRDLSREDIASHVFLSTWYVGKFFKQKTGVSLNDYHLKIRIEHAIEELKQNKKIAQISDELGYTNRRQFLRNFKEYTGSTPTDYKKQFLEQR